MGTHVHAPRHVMPCTDDARHDGAPAQHFGATAIPGTRSHLAHVAMNMFNAHIRQHRYSHIKYPASRILHVRRAEANFGGRIMSPKIEFRDNIHSPAGPNRAAGLTCAAGLLPAVHATSHDHP
jgi:hypothetical protein